MAPRGQALLNPRDKLPIVAKREGVLSVIGASDVAGSGREAPRLSPPRARPTTTLQDRLEPVSASMAVPVPWLGRVTIGGRANGREKPMKTLSRL